MLFVIIAKKNKRHAIEETNRRIRKIKACPVWVDKEEIKKIYLNRNGLTVDHIIPLINRDICGLHVPWNLNYLSSEENSKKNNSFDYTYDNNGWKKK